MATKPIPEGYHTLTLYLAIDGAAEAIEFYKKAFGAQEIMRMEAPGGKIGHAELKIGDSIIMVGDEMPQMGNRSPVSLGGTTSGVFLYVEDVDKLYQQAVTAGARADMPPQNM